MRKVVRILFIFLAVLSFVPKQANADSNGRIRGTVTDASGAAVAGATVKIVNTAMGLQRDVTSADLGTFEAPDLPPGLYDITVTKAGFKTLKQGGTKTGIGRNVQCRRNA